MRLCFLGDVAVDQPTTIAIPSLGTYDAVIANLEGPLLRDRDFALLHKPRTYLPVYNTSAAVDLLRAFHITGLCLANNHIYDLLLPANYTQCQLAEHDIATFGAGDSLASANQPLELRAGETTVKIFGFGWKVIGCRTTKGSYEGVNPLSPKHMLATIRHLRQTDSSSFVVYYLHWNYELERYPQPAHRQLAHDLIAEGVDAVIGLHPHVVQGIETVKGKPIVYSLGNWYFPPRSIGNFRLQFPEISKRQLAFEIDVSRRKVISYAFNWYLFDANSSSLILEARETSEAHPIAAALTPYIGLSHTTYEHWFSEHRIRRRGVPIYRNYHHTIRNSLRDSLLFIRHTIIQRLVRLGLKRALTG